MVICLRYQVAFAFQGRSSVKILDKQCGILYSRLIAIILGWLYLLLSSGWNAKNVATASRPFVLDALGCFTACRTRAVAYTIQLDAARYTNRDASG